MVLNFHSYGNDFIYPYSGSNINTLGHDKPEIKQRFDEIIQEGNFSQDTHFGWSMDVLKKRIGGCASDWIT